MTKSKTTQRIYISSIQAVAALFTSFNFDVLKEIVEDMNRYDECPPDVLEYLNIRPDGPASSTTARGRRSAPRGGVATQSGESPS